MYKIVPMEKEHIESVFGLEKMCFAHPWVKGAFENEMENKNAYYFVALDGQNQILGYGGFWCVWGEGQITNIAVHPEKRRMHIGETLLDSIIKKAEDLKAEVLTLEVRVSNMAAQSLYEKKGFEKVGVRKRYYTDNGEDAFLMFRNIG